MSRRIRNLTRESEFWVQFQTGSRMVFLRMRSDKITKNAENDIKMYLKA